MLLLRALLITAVATSGIAIVLWLVSLITGESNSLMGLVLGVCFALVAVWAYLGLKHAHEHGKSDRTT